MNYRNVPKNNDALSVLGFGCMRLPVTDTGAIDETRAIAQIRHAIDNGVNYLDTAWPYHSGASEPLIGKALASGYRSRVRIATKLPSWMVQTTRDMDAYLDEQLKRLNTDTIDYYLLHNLAGPMWDHLKSLDVLSFIDRAKADGRILNAGFSFHGNVDDFKRIVDGYPWEICQIQYNYLDTAYQAGTQGLHYAASRNLGVIIMEPLRGGSLGAPEPPPDVAAVWQKSALPRTPVEWALRWVWNHPEVTVVLSGMNQEDHIDENLAIAEQAGPESLTREELSLIQEAAETYRRLMRVNCTGCEYCKPCPSDVNISACFELLNRLHLFKNPEEAKFMYAVRASGIIGTGNTGYASQCTHCRECLDKCPQGILIPDMLEEAMEQLEDEQLDQRVAMAKKMLAID